MSVETKEKVCVEWYCGNYRGAFQWRFAGDWLQEPDECGTTFQTIEEKYDFFQNECSAICPKCHATLTQADDEPKLKDIIMEEAKEPQKGEGKVNMVGFFGFFGFVPRVVEHSWMIQNKKTGKFLFLERYFCGLEYTEGCWVEVNEADRYKEAINLEFVMNDAFEWFEGEKPELDDLVWRGVNVTFDVM